MIKVSGGLIPCEGESVPPGFWWFAGNLWCSLACRCTTPIFAFILTWWSPCVYVFGSKFRLFIRHKSYWIRAHPKWPHLGLINLGEDLISKQGRTQGLGLPISFWGKHSSTHKSNPLGSLIVSNSLFDFLGFLGYIIYKLQTIIGYFPTL